jgi:hypothetical protein
MLLLKKVNNLFTFLACGLYKQGRLQLGRPKGTVLTQS